MVGPDFERPEAPYLGSWSKGAGLPVDAKTGFTTRSAAVNNWWTLFKDPTLTALIDEAYQAERRFSRPPAPVSIRHAPSSVWPEGELFPQQQQAKAGVEKVQLSENEPLVRDVRQFIPLDPELHPLQHRISMPGGKSTCGARSAATSSPRRANLLYQIASYDDALVTLTGDIAATYVTIRELQGLIAITRRNLALQKKSLDIAKVKLEGGTTTRLDVDEATAAYNSTLATLPGLSGRSRTGHERHERPVERAARRCGAAAEEICPPAARTGNGRCWRSRRHAAPPAGYPRR